MEKTEENATFQDENEEFQPPDGGFRGFLVVSGAFFCHGVLGIIYSYGVFYESFYTKLAEQNETDVAGKAGLIGSLSMGTFFLMSPLSGILTDLIGIQMTTLLGGVLATFGMFASSFCTSNALGLYLTFSISCGSGVALAFTPSLVILGHYYKRHLGLVTGIVTTGTAIYGVCIPYLVITLVAKYDIEITLRIMSLLFAGIIFAAFIFKPLNKDKFRNERRRIFNINVFKNKKYLLWVLTLTLCSYGGMVPYIYIADFVKSMFADVDTTMPIVFSSVGAGFGRFFFGVIGDHPKVNRLVLQQIAFAAMGMSTILMPFSYFSYIFLNFLSATFGLFDGCFASVFAPFVYEICDTNDVSQAIGFTMGLLAIPATIGPYIGGVILERTRSYLVVFIVAGIPSFIAALALLSLKLVKIPQRNSK